MKSVNDVYIDLGTSNTHIYLKSNGFKISEPTVLAFKIESEKKLQLSAIGHRAKYMIGKTPLQMTTAKPLKEGVISNFEQATQLIELFINKINLLSFYRRPRLIISLPCMVNQHERKAVRDLGLKIGTRTVELLDEPMAAAVGAGLPILSHVGQMIVDLGGGTTEAALISCGGIVTSSAFRMGGTHLDEAIIEHLKSKYFFFVGEQTAELIKIKVANAALKLNSVVKSIEVGGINLRSGLPRKMSINSQMIFEPIDNYAKNVKSIINKTFENCPPELSGDIAQNGIFLAGGGALLGGLAQRIAYEVGVSVKVIENPIYSVAKGGAKVLEEHKLFDRLKVS